MIYIAKESLDTNSNESQFITHVFLYCRAKRLIWVRTRYHISKRDIYNTKAAMQRRENARIPVSNHTHAIESSRAAKSVQCSSGSVAPISLIIIRSIKRYTRRAREGGRGIEIIDRDLVGEGAPLYVNIYKSDNASALAGAPHVFRHKIHSTLDEMSGTTAVTHIDDARARASKSFARLPLRFLRSLSYTLRAACCTTATSPFV
uniref:Uncharacterized protein n=1 Tax=Trichogramma kaykai TaxID=54128 RepID=A0ABD2WTH0_9HYME